MSRTDVSCASPSNGTHVVLVRLLVLSDNVIVLLRHRLLPFPHRRIARLRSHSVSRAASPVLDPALTRLGAGARAGRRNVAREFVVRSEHNVRRSTARGGAVTEPASSGEDERFGAVRVRRGGRVGGMVGRGEATRVGLGEVGVQV